MEYENKLTFQVYGARALFSDPVSRVGGEKFSYMFPTYQALKGITESIYWKPSIVWRIIRVRVMNKIQMESSGIRPIRYNANTNDLSYYTYLKDVCYHVEVQFEWNKNRPELKNDWNEDKHFQIAKRSIEKGGRRDVFLGTRECQAYVEPCIFDEGSGHYDEEKELTFGYSFHSFIYPDEQENDGYQGLTACFWRPVMKKGVIEFIQPEETELKRNIYKSTKKDFIPNENFTFTKEVIE
ncbi:MAG: type I-C CRISPR-associated protein Cas5c [Tissierellia bacterium]|nr:type I-C CRISPR-associated protein Cas5c [Tissierellia bacterium]